ncbi:798_t:CDS:2 [Paraglomus occultum]|uniref:Endosomal/vacuolar adapter protein YPT35 n=1 Tax=Paraglomus occultum TaxID=144539 RepID=A0A9N8WN28_9GLOM|nr:798_t:CDS:2 [Paraglomus occultum]
MELQAQVQDLLDLSSNVTALLQKQTDSLIRQRSLVRRDKDEDYNSLNYDIELASRSLHVLEVRREIRTAVSELTEVRDQMKQQNGSPTRDWLDYVQVVMEHLHTLLKKGLDLASIDDAKSESLVSSSSRKELAYQSNSAYHSFTSSRKIVSNDQPKITITTRNTASNYNKPRRISNSTPFDPSADTQKPNLRADLTRRHSLDSEGISAARLFIGNLGLRAAPPKATTTTSVSQDLTTTNKPNVSSHKNKGGLHRHNQSSNAEKQLTQIISQDSEEMSDQFVDAVERQEDVDDDGGSVDRGKVVDTEELSTMTEKLMNRANIFHNSVMALDTVIEDDGQSQSSMRRLGSYVISVSNQDLTFLYALLSKGDNDDVSSLAPSLSSGSSSPISSPILTNTSYPTTQISLARDKPTHLFAEEVTVSDPLRVGAGYGSYIEYTCTVKGPEGTSITVRKRYSEFVKLRTQLSKAQPHFKNLIPKLPPKKVVGKFGTAFVERRRKDLEYFLTYILLHPTLGATPVVRKWFMS